MRKNLLVPLALVLAGSGMLALRGGGDTPVRFPHVVHAEAGLECAQCHAAEESRHLRESLLPEPSVCLDCHTEEDLASWGYDTRARSDARLLSFSHEAHIGAGMECVDCHAAVLDPAVYDGTLPGHELCFTCHDQIEETRDCASCHPGLEEGRLSGWQPDLSGVRPIDHHPGFLRNHEFRARLDGGECRECHVSEDYCSTCHQGPNVEVMTHPRNWVHTHPVTARKDLHDCQSCHDLGGDCAECHLSLGVRPADHALPGWTGPPYLHGRAGRRDLETCAACHERDHFSCATSPMCHGNGANRGR